MYQCEVYRDHQAINQVRRQWNQLALASGVEIASHQLEVLEDFRKCFAPERELVLIAVRDQNGQLVGGLPLLTATGRLMSGYQTVSNEWFQVPQPLIAKDVDLLPIAQQLVAGLKSMTASRFVLDWIAIDDPIWQAILSVAQHLDWAIQCKARFEVGITHLPSSWHDFEMSLSKNCRKRCRSEWKQMSQAGQVRLQVVDTDTAETLEESFETALQIELESWKGKQGSAITCQRHSKEFYFQWASLLRQCGALRLFLLRLNDQAIAFDMGLVEGDRYRSVKVSYKESHASFSPGHVLNQLVFQHFITNSQVKIIDTVGPMNDANRRWSNDCYRMGRMIIAPGTWATNVAGRSLVSLLNVRAAWMGGNDSLIALK